VTHKIIFLDVDGVLNCGKTWEGPHEDGLSTLDPVLCDRLATIVQETGAIVVLSSTWRLFPGEPLEKLTWWLRMRGIHIHSHTKDLSMQIGWGNVEACRGDEIALWLEEHEDEFPRLEREFVILDDDSDMLPLQRPHHVHTSFKDGLTEAHMLKAIGMLNG
jgi:histidinol phosphatase-like enzyme